MVPVKALLRAQTNATLKRLSEQLHPCELLVEKIEKELQESAPMLLHQGGVIKDGVYPNLDEYRGLANTGKDYLLKIQQREIQQTGISSLNTTVTMSIIQLCISLLQCDQNNC